MKPAFHTFAIRVYYEDTDMAGIVYYANYLKFAERARTEALRQGGIDQSALMQRHQVGFVVRKCVCDFLKPSMLDDLLTIETRLHDISRVSLRMQQTISRGDEILVEMEIKLGVVRGSDKRVTKLPDVVRDAMMKVFSG